MAGHIVAIKVDYLIDGPGGPERVTVDLASILQHCRPERVQDLLEDVELLSEDVLAGRRPENPGHPVLSVIRGSR